MCQKHPVGEVHLKRFALVASFFLCALILSIALPGCGGGGSHRTLYIISAGNPAVGSFNIGNNGALTLNSTSIAAGSDPQAIVMDSKRRYAYVVNNAGPGLAGGVLQYSIDHGHGTLAVVQAPNASSNLTTAVPPVVTGVQPMGAAVDPSNNFVFVANYGSDSISVFSLDTTDGALTPVSGGVFQEPAGSKPVGLVARGTSLFVANQGTGNVAAYTYDSKGILTLAGTVTVGANTTAINADAGGATLYVADGTANTVTAISVSGSTLTVGSSTAVGTAPSSISTDPSGKYLFVTNSGSNDVSAFTIGGGSLTQLSGSPFKTGANPSFSTTNPAGTVLYVANKGDATVSSFQIGGGLTEISGSPFAATGFNAPDGLAAAD
jgi:6-phosphogluconolactonase (cycloisomerase 2 family)